MFSFSNESSSSLVIPKSSLGYKTNNKYKQFPPMMKDGRSVISSWQNETQINHELIKDNNITSNWQYRQYLTKHADTIMEYNYRESANDTGYILPTKQKEKEKKNELIIPYTFDSLNDKTKPFESSDLKNLYLTREQLNAKKIAPIIYKN
jgi:uncharacterized protein YwqG